MMVVYFAHPVGAPTTEGVIANLARARRWLAWLLMVEPEVAFCAPWLPYLDIMADSPANRERGLRDDCEIAGRCDGIILVGGGISNGMTRESMAVLAAGGWVSDCTWLGLEPPTFGDVSPIAAGRAKR